jgi:hypothetical protein
MRRPVGALVAAVLLAVGLVAAGRSGAAAPPAPVPITLPCATNASVQVLGRGTSAAAEGQELVLARVTFGPGGGIGPHTHPGTLVQTVESGILGFTLIEEGEMALMRSGGAGTPAAAEPLPVGEEVQLHPGDWFVETGMVHTGRTVGDEPVVLTYAGLFTAGQPLTSCVDGTPTP